MRASNRSVLCFWLLALIVFLAAPLPASSEDPAPRMPEQVHAGELVSFPGPWGFLPKVGIVLVTDEELETLAKDPDQVINIATSLDPQEASLRTICEQGRDSGARMLMLAYDQFFKQYRPGQDRPRRLTPDMDEYVGHIAKIGAFAQEYGLELELSLLSPLEIGPAYQRETGESGVWMQYRKGLRSPQTGAFSVQLWRQRKWANNKGVIEPEPAGVRVFAFKEWPVGGTPYRVVAPESIVEISELAQVEVWPDVTAPTAERVVIRGEGRTEIGDLDRVLVVQTYRTPEMDYFSPKALPYLQQLVDKYADAGVKLNGLYADEMHIQQDWAYFSHHDNGAFTQRYVSPGFANAYADAYGEEYRDFAKYLVYFAYGQEDFAPDLSAKAGVSHVFGDSPEAIRRTALFRARYYRLLQDGVTDLFVAAKRHAEERMGKRLESRAHATWAESPTIDKWETGRGNHQRHQYEYTSNFVWSCTVHQSASACSDYFKWGDFLTGNGNDHPEGGWLDRNYFGLSLACSTGILNEVPYSYGAHWGMPGPISHWRNMVASTFGSSSGSDLWGMVTDRQHRDVDVLMLYPIDLVAVEERFGSWMTQYAYANYVTQQKLLERGVVVNGAIEMAGRRFTTLVALFEPFPSERLLALARELVESGGRVVWSAAPPVLTAEGGDAQSPWQDLFGVDYPAQPEEGLRAPGRIVAFEGALEGVVPQTILTDFLVDRIYPVAPREGTAIAARVTNHVVGTQRLHPGGGAAAFLGYRPRDDQSKSLGYETRNWFEVLLALGAYAPTGRIAGVNDNTEYVSRTSDYLACRFPNGATAIARHLRELEEDWSGGFGRDGAADAAYVAAHPLPDDSVQLDGFKVNGHEITYSGKQAVIFRTNERGDLIAFAGIGCDRIVVDGRTFVFSDAPLNQIAWAPVPEARRVPGGAIFEIRVFGHGTIRIPRGDLPERVQLFAQGALEGSRGAEIPTRWEDDALVFDVRTGEAHRPLWLVPAR